MGFKVTEWDYSSEMDATQIPFETGDRYLLISDARFNNTYNSYTITFEDFKNKAVFDVVWYLTSQDGTSNSKARGTLISLGVALAGTPIGIPHPDDIKGGVVRATITEYTSKKTGERRASIYKFLPVTESWAALGKIDQFFLPDEEGA